MKTATVRMVVVISLMDFSFSSVDWISFGMGREASMRGGPSNTCRWGGRSTAAPTGKEFQASRLTLLPLPPGISQQAQQSGAHQNQGGRLGSRGWAQDQRRHTR